MMKFSKNWFVKLANHRMALIGLAVALPLSGIVTTAAIASNQTTPAIQMKTIVEEIALPKVQSVVSTTRYWREDTLANGESIAKLLSRLGIESKDANAFLASGDVSKQVTKLPRGTTLSVLSNDAGELFAMRFMNDDQNGEAVLVRLEKTNQGVWQTSADAPDTQTIEVVKTITVSSSLKQALSAQKVPTEIAAQLDDIFADQIDIDTLKPKSSIHLVYETHIYQGQTLGVGKILAAEIKTTSPAKTPTKTQGKKKSNVNVFQAIYFAEKNSESGSYFSQDGEPLKLGFSSEPVKNARMSSAFGIRVHPILKSVKMHKGVDYAAPTGTPIVAPAAGTVVTIATQSGYGRVVEVRHNAKTTTFYAHLSDHNVSLGQQVKAGDVIAKVGNTGRSTGAHLHFEVRINGQQVDPATNALKSPVLAGAQKRAFLAQTKDTKSQLSLTRSIAAASSR